MYLLKRLFVQSRKLFIVSTLVGMLSGVFFMCLISYVNNFISLEEAGSAGVEHLKLFLVVLGVVSITNFYSQRVMALLGLDVTHNLTIMMVERILSTSLSKVERVGKNRLYASMTQDIQAVNTAINILPPVIVNLTTIVVGILYMLMLSWEVVFIQLTLIVGLIVVAITSAKILRRLMDKMRQRTDYLFHIFEGFFEGVKELKMNRTFKKHFFTNKFIPTRLELKSIAERVSIIFAASYVFYDMLFFLAIGFCLFVAPTVLGVDIIAASGIAFVLLFIRSPSLMLYHTVPDIARGDVALKKIIEVTEGGLSLDEELNNKKLHSTEEINGWKSLSLSGINYEYPDRAEVSGAGKFHLGPVNMSIRPGEVIFIAGGNGAGKSTLAKIITGLYRATSGKLLLNDKPVAEGEEEYIRDYFACIFSDFYLFSEMAEIYVGDEKLNELNELLKELQLESRIDFKNNIVPTRQLSTGQRKRLALLFAIAADKPIFVLDEWAADQDPGFREYFYRKIIPKLKLMRKGVLVISHDDRYFDCADKLYKLDRGSFSEVVVGVPTVKVNEPEIAL